MAFESSSHSGREHYRGRHRFEHWYRDNTVYFITARVRDRFHASPRKWPSKSSGTASDTTPPSTVTSLGSPPSFDNHYHSLGYLKEGKQLGQMMRKLHGSVAKLVNDTRPSRHLPFWRSTGGHDYFDGCLRDETQCRRAYRYTLWQCRRHGYCKDWHG